MFKLASKEVFNFHFEIAADLLDKDELDLLSTMRPGLVQLEIGIQSTNEKTLEAIRRKTDIEEIREITETINSWHNIHQHLDLIAGLPWEDLESFKKSFNDVYEMEPEQLQLGFLKVLKGSYMEELIPTCDLLYSAAPPYEVLCTKWLSYGDVLELKDIEEMTEVHYNSRQFTCTLKELENYRPYGPKNPKIRFHFYFKVDRVEQLGDGTHIKLTNNTTSLELIGFHMYDAYLTVGAPEKIEVIGYLSERWVNGKSTSQIEMLCFQPAKE